MSFPLAEFFPKGEARVSVFDFGYFFLENRNRLEQISDDTVIGHLEDRCFRILVNGNNTANIGARVMVFNGLCRGNA